MDISKIVKNLKDYWVKMDKIDRWIVLLLILSFLIKLSSVLYLPFRGWDETVYLNLGYDLSKNPFNYFLLDSGWSDFIPSTDIIYGWPNIGFRAPLLPYIISIFYLLRLDFLIHLIIPLVTTLSILLIYKLGKILFNKNVGLYAALLFSLVPIHIYSSGRIWTDAFVVFFILLTFISFWEGYENKNKNHKILFGLFLALSLLARYTTLWIAPVFLLYFIIRDKSFKFLQDKYLWYAVLVFFLILIPWFIYGFVFYGNPLGGFIHGFKASGYWGGVQSWNYFFENSWRIFSITGALFVISLFFIFLKKEFLKKEVYILLIWIIFFSTIVMMMPHKEDRFIMPVVPVICLISGLFISKLNKWRNLLLGIVGIILVFSLWNSNNIESKNSKDLTLVCFSEGTKFLASDSIAKNSLIVTNQDPITHYYTKKDILIYPNPWDFGSIANIIGYNNENRDVYIFFANYDMLMESSIKNDLDNNLKKVFECSKEYGYSAIYKYK